MPSSKLSALLATLGLFFIPATVNLEVPLYPVYASLAQVGTGISSLTQLGYCLGALPVLIFFGGLPQRWGSRAVLKIALAHATFSTILMIFVPTLAALFLARVLHGVAIAFGLSSGATFLSENDPEKNLRNSTASIVSVTTALGFGAGALSTALLLRQTQTLTPLSLAVGAAATALVFAGLFCEKSSSPLTTHTPLVRAPAFPPGALFCGLVIAAAWAVSGVVIAVVPGALATHHLENYSGIALFFVNATGAACFPFVRKWPALKLLKVGLPLLALGGFVLASGVSLGMVGLVLCGAVLCGAASYGFCYLGSLALLDSVSGNEKSRALAGYFMMAYLGFCLPSILIGFVADSLGIKIALFGFASVLALCSAALGNFTPRSNSLSLKPHG